MIHAHKKQMAFTLVEAVITIVITGIIFAVVSVFLNRPIQAYTKTYARSDMATIADNAITRMERDTRNAVANSIRVKTSGNFSAFEMANALEGMRYRLKKATPPSNNTTYLTFTGPDSDFNVLEAAFQNASLGTNGYRLVIYNTGQYTGTSDSPNAGVNLYSPSTAPGPVPPAGTHVITPSATSVTFSVPSGEAHVHLNPGMQFALQSPRQRIYVVDTPVTYLCDTTAGVGTLTRYWGYPIGQIQPINPGIAPLSTAQSAILAKNVSACSFSYSSGTSSRSGIISMSITITRGGESVKVFHQVSVSNQI